MRLGVIALIGVDEVDVRAATTCKGWLVVEVDAAQRDGLALVHQLRAGRGDVGSRSSCAQRPDHDDRGQGKKPKCQYAYFSNIDVSSADHPARAATMSYRPGTTRRPGSFDLPRLIPKQSRQGVGNWLFLPRRNPNRFLAPSQTSDVD